MPTHKITGGKPGPGRPKGSPNKTTALLKDAILKAAEGAGGAEGLVGYLQMQANANPGPFMSLLGKVLPSELNATLGVDDSISQLFQRIAEKGRAIHDRSE